MGFPSLLQGYLGRNEGASGRRNQESQGLENQNCCFENPQTPWHCRVRLIFPEGSFNDSLQLILLAFQTFTPQEAVAILDSGSLLQEARLHWARLSALGLLLNFLLCPGKQGLADQDDPGWWSFQPPGASHGK